MTRYLALLRSVNVGGNNRVPMPALREGVAALGYGDVTTYIASGNVLFSSDDDPAVIASRIEALLATAFDVRVPVLVRSKAEMEGVLSRNPYAFEGADPSRLLVLFLRDAPDAAAIARIDPDRSPPDEAKVVGRELYAWCPNTFAKTKLTLDYLERRLGTVGSGRNWNTTRTLAGML